MRDGTIAPFATSDRPEDASRRDPRLGALAAACLIFAFAVVAPQQATATATDGAEPASTSPTIAMVTISSTPSFDADGDNTADTYVRRDRIVVDVRFSEAVTVSGGNNAVRLRLDLGADDTNFANSRRVLRLKSVVGGDTLRFEHRVTASDSDPDGVWVQTVSATNAQTVFTVRGAAVTSTSTGVAAVLTKSGLATSGAATHKVDGSRTQAAANRAPSFPAVPPGTPATLHIVDENNAAGAPVVTVAATDPDGDALTYALDSASDAVFDIDSSGNITVPAANALDHETQANYTITVSVHDGKNAAGAVDTTVDATRRVRIAVADLEEPPVFPANAPTTLEVAENNAAGAPVGTVSATDSDGDALTYALDSASDAVFDIDSSGNITVTAANALDYETTASYTVTVSVHDGKDAAGQPDTTVDATHSVTIRVTNVEERPAFPANAPTNFEVAENNAAGAPVGTASATDTDGDALTYALDSASDAVFDIDSSGNITVTAANALDYETTASYSVTVSVHDGKDPAGNPDTTVDATHSVTIRVTNVEESPAFPANAPTNFEVAENNAAGAAVGTVSATDPDGDALTYALDSASDAVFDIDSNGNITVTAANALDYETTASYTVTVSVHDGKDAAGQPDTTVDATHSVTIAVTDAEESTGGPPTIASVTISSTPSFDADSDNTADTYVRHDKIVVDVRFSEAVTVSGGNNNVRLRLDLGADDSNLANSRRVLKLKSVVGGDTLRFEHRVTVSDSDPDGVWVQTVSATNAKTVFAVHGATVTGTATGTAAVLTKSGMATSGAATHKVDGSRTQAAANRAPSFPAVPPGTPATLHIVDENNAAGAPVVTVAATDPDGDALTYALDSASDAVFDIDSSGNITVPAANALDHETQANYTITVSVHDGKNAAGAVDTTVDATRRVRIAVADLEEPPVFPANAPTTLEVAENNAAGAPVGTVSATDSDGDALTYALDSASDAVFDIDSSGNITVTAANALDNETTASYSATVSVHDGKDAAGEPDTTVDATHSVTIRVTNVEEPPAFPANAPTTLEVAENNAAGAPVGTVSATDPDGDALTYALDSASDAVFDIDSSGAITVTAANALDYETTASYTVTVSVHDGKDAAGQPNTAVDATHSLTIAVTDVEESTGGPPTIASVTIGSTPSFDADSDNTADTYVRRDKIVVDVRFSEAVTVSGGNNNVRLRLDLGADDSNLANSRRVLKLKSVVGGNTLRFEHRVTASDSDPDGVWVQTISATNAKTVFTVHGATVTGTATGTAAVLTKSGMATSGAATHKVDGSRTQTPAAANRAPTFPATAPATFEVAENNAAGAAVGTVAATDPDGDALTYTLDSASDAVFDIDTSGNITVTAADALDYDTTASYAVTVSVHDGKDAAGAADTTVDATHSVTITVTEAPAVLAPAKPVVVFGTNGGGSLTSTGFDWRLPVQPAGVTVSAVEVQVLVGHSPPWRTVASLAPVADGELMSHTVIGLTPGEWYFVRIRLVTNSGNADSENIVMIKTGLPNPVTDLSLSNVTRTSVDLSWTMPPITNSSPSVRALNVQQRGANGSWSTVATITPDEQAQTFPPLTEDPHYSRPHRVPTLYTVTGLTAGTSYTFRIRLVANGDADSETVSTTTLGGSLNPVGGLTASNSTATTIDLGWALPTQPAGVTVTGLEVQQQSGDSWTTVASLGADATSLTVTDLTEGTTYTFRVRLAANNGTADSETVSATALAPPKPATDLAASNPSRTGIDFSWTLPAQSLGVTVSAVEVQYRYATSKGLGYNDWTWGTLATLASDATSYTVTQVTPGTNYAFRIRLATNNGHADSESVAAAALQPPKPATGLSFSNVTGTTVDLSWTFPAQPEGVVVTAVEVHSGGLIKPGEENVPNFSSYGLVELDGDATSITWPVLHGGFTHNFRVRLITNSGEVDSQVASWSSTRPYPKRATDLTASNATQTTVDLAWTLPQQPGVTVSAVEVRWGADEEDDPWDNLSNTEALASDAASHTVTGLSAGTNYIFLVRLVTSSGNRNSDFLYATTPSGAVSAPGLSVADASANEGADAAVEFEVTLSQAASGTVTVDYATANIRFAASNGGAMAGEDYTAVSGTLTFAAGETVKTVSVPILDDAIDEGAETFTLQLRNAEGAWISDAEATGTITNSDPLQKMWLSRFGRTVAGHVTDAVSDRLSGPLTGAQVTVGGQAVDLTATEDEALLGETMTSVARALGAADGPEPGSDGWSGADGGGFRSLGSSPVRTMSGRELLLGSSFHLAREGEGGGPGFAAWGRVAVGGFDGEAPSDAGSVRIDGDVTTGVLGADASWDRLLAGVAVSLSEGEGAFDQPGVDSGTIESTMTVVSPYGRVNLSERVSAWGLVGFGTGDMTIVQAANDRGQPERVTRTDLGMRLAAVGSRGALLEADETGGMDLALKTDAFFVETESEAISNEGSTTADASRVRLALEGGRAFAFGGGATLRPSLEFGLRHDGGDAETGMGVEVGGGVSYADAASGLSIEAKARMLVAHADSDYEEWGASASVRLAPGERGRGLSFSLSPTVGAAASAEERLWGAQRPDDFAPVTGEFAASRGLDAELGYGLSLFGNRFTGTPNVGFALSDSARDYRIGWRLTSAIKGDPGFEVNLDATRREATVGNEPPEHGVMLRGAIRW